MNNWTLSAALRPALGFLLLLPLAACNEECAGGEDAASAPARRLEIPRRAGFGRKPSGGSWRPGSLRETKKEPSQALDAEESRTPAAVWNGDSAALESFWKPGGPARAEVPEIKGTRPVAKPRSDLSELPAGPVKFAQDRGKARTVAVRRLLPNEKRSPLAFTSDMDIDADGAGGHWRGDRTGQSATSLRYRNGESLNPGTLPFVVVPVDFHKSHPEIGLGDYAAVVHKGKIAYAIVGDKGPKGVLGEGSIALAKALGINPDPNRGGTSKPVSYILFPGTRDAEPPRDSAQVARKGKALTDALARQDTPIEFTALAPTVQ